MTPLSVIIPLAPSETAWKNLLSDLTKLQDGTEILFVTSQKKNSSHQTILLPNKEIRFLKSKPGRANQMNTGAKAAKGKYLWFLHADSKFGCDTLSALLRAIQNHPQSLLYFDLAFSDKTTPLMFLNVWGTHFRSRIFKIPFGDQGFCIERDLFQMLGGFPENLPYGEDHVFVWKARQHGVKVQPVCATLYTSARKYKKHGWLKTTFMHQYLWIKQAWPQWKKLRSCANNTNGALAIFAKTTGLSPVKTRLANDIGTPLAEAFYILCTEAVAEIAKATQKQSNNVLVPYWALAEENAVNLECWNKFSTLWTGEGDLGKRLHNIYSTLSKKHDYVIMIGTDSPQLEPELLMDAIKKLSEQPKSCVIGPATDGGFYLFAAGITIPENVWTNATYSKHTTLQELTEQLAKHKIPVHLLSMQGDIDIAADLKPLIKALGVNHNLLPAQKKLYRWLQKQVEIINLPKKKILYC